MDTAERKIAEVRAAYAALAGTPDQAACSAQYAAIEAAYAALVMEAKAYDLGVEGRRWVHAFRLARTEKEKQEKYTLAKKARSAVRCINLSITAIDLAGIRGQPCDEGATGLSVVL